MSETSVQASPVSPAPPAPAAESAPAKTSRPRVPKSWGRRVLEVAASLKITVALLAMAIVLVFCGTLAQVYHGIWVVVKVYFRSFVVWIPFQVFFPTNVQLPKILGVPIGFPFLGGWGLGVLLLVNLLAAHITRFKVSWKRSGILLIHAGLIVLMMSELITGLFAVEGNMTIPTGSSTNFVERNDRMEFAVVAPIDKDKEAVTAVPCSILRKRAVITNENLPFDIRVVRYMPNTKAFTVPDPRAANPATAGFGLRDVAVEQPEGVGVDSDQKFDAPSAYLELKLKGSDEPPKVYLVSALLPAQTVTVGGQELQISLRPHRDYKPYSIYLKDFTHSIYPGTDIPKDFRSRVHVTGEGEDRDAEIYMNAPLRFQGETFYQAGVYGRDEGTVLQVVRNPGWVLPYVACAMVILGLAVHFGLSLIGFLRRVMA